MSNIIRFPVSRIVRLIPADQGDTRWLDHARKCERVLYELEEKQRWANVVSIMSGAYADTIPSDVEQVS